ncbi:MAG: hypothetical protein ABJH06_05110 [Paraglaciecola sp.]|uniref:hypothetical protein n=1 Tax=Paraglaciecola sp. TaxID=1920173 RepID=UPI003299741B
MISRLTSTAMFSLRFQRGAIVLLTVTLLLIIVSLVTLYTGKIQTFEHKITLNEQSLVLAKAKSEEGLQRVIALLNADKAIVTTISNSAIVSDGFTAVYGTVETITNNRLLVSLTSYGTSPDGLASVNTQQQILIYPLMFNNLISPLIVQGGVLNEGEIEVVANPDGLGVGKPLSIWSDLSIDFISSDHHSCLKSEFDHGQCSSSSISNKVIQTTDLVESSVTFPGSLSEYLFNIETTDILELKSQAKFVFSGCEHLSDMSYGMIWIEGDCEVDFSTTVGSPSKPVVMIVMNGDINLLDDATIYGLVCSFRSSNSVLSLSVNMHSGALISGGLVSNHALGVHSTTTRVVYDAQVANALVTLDSLQMLANVPGSWNNF